MRLPSPRVRRTRAVGLGARRGQKSHLATCGRCGHAHLIEEDVITREEVVALLFDARDMATAHARIERLLEEDDGEEDDTG